MTEARLSRAELMAYGSLRMPLALLELPLFVLLPILYNRSFGLELSIIGAILFASRAVDALADPLIGTYLDRTRRSFDFPRWIRAALPVLVIAFAALLLPPVRGAGLAIWLTVFSVLAYLAYSVVSIAFQSWGASLSPLPEEQVRLTTTRETFGMVGVLLAVMLLSPEHTGKLAIGFCALALLASLWSYRAPAPRHRGLGAGLVSDTALATNSAEHGDQGDARRAEHTTGLSRVRQNGAFRWLLTTFVFNGVATAIPATLVLFFSADVLKASTEQSALFLGAYFLAAALGMPFWLWFSRQFGLRNAWLIGIAIAVIGFVWTLGLGPGDHTTFMLVCVATGFALGSDLAMPPALLALVIAAHGDRGAHEGAYFGIWNLATKLNLAIAAGLALPLTQWLGQYWSAGPAQALALIYAGLPSALKLIAGFVLVISPLPGGNPPTPLSESTT